MCVAIFFMFRVSSVMLNNERDMCVWSFIDRKPQEDFEYPFSNMFFLSHVLHISPTKKHHCFIQEPKKYEQVKV